MFAPALCNVWGDMGGKLIKKGEAEQANDSRKCQNQGSGQVKLPMTHR